MPTKLRVLIKQRGKAPIYGINALKMLTSAAKKHILNINLPEGWPKKSRKERMEFLAQFLPDDCRFFLVREQKGNRRARSVYNKMIKGRWLPHPIHGEEMVPEVMPETVRNRPQQVVIPASRPQPDPDAVYSPGAIAELQRHINNARQRRVRLDPDR